MRSPYSLDEDQAAEIQSRIFEKLDVDKLAEGVRKDLQKHVDYITDNLTDYLKGEYSLVIEAIAKERAKRFVEELLKGNASVAEFFHLKSRELTWGVDAGKLFAYDPAGVVAAIVETFKDDIQTTQMQLLQEENKRLQESLKFERECRNRY
jgi:hypothetical protein